MNTIITIAICTIALMVAIFAGSRYIANRMWYRPRPVDEVERSLSDMLAAFRREADKLVSRYAEEFALVRFLEQADREGRSIDAVDFKAGALNRANLLRIKQLEDAIASHVAAKTELVKTLKECVKSQAAGAYAGYGTSWPTRIKQSKDQIEIEEKYISSLQDQLRGLRVSAVPAS